MSQTVGKMSDRNGSDSGSSSGSGSVGGSVCQYNIADVLIRVATVADLADIHRMQISLADHELPFDDNIDLALKKPEKSGYIGYVNIEEKIRLDDNYVVVAEAAGKVVGVCYGQIKKDDDWSKLDVFGYVGCVFVERAYRGGGENGVWPRMLLELENWFRDRNIQQIRLDCYEGNVGAIKSYQKLDFKPHQIIMTKNL
jgi:ribosomal protein S18 acetylase RimI-like enzyme